MNDKHFIYFWESTISPDTPANLVAKWREHELSAIQRGEFVVKRLAQFNSLTEQRVLDMGCGYGGLSVALTQAGASVVGVDFDSQRLLGATVRVKYDHPSCEVQLAQAAAEEIPFQDASFDVVVCNDVIEHVRSHAQTLSEIERILKPGGWAYLSFPNRFSLANVRCDPHYGLLGISILPPQLGTWYVVSLRRRATSYSVGLFPIASEVIRTLKNMGIQVIKWWPAPQRRIGLLTPLLELYRLNTQPLVVLVCQKTN